jgi:hypothetical protein
MKSQSLRYGATSYSAVLLVRHLLRHFDAVHRHDDGADAGALGESGAMVYLPRFM